MAREEDGEVVGTVREAVGGAVKVFSEAVETDENSE